MNIKSFTAIVASKFTIKICRKFLNGGTNFPGKVALKIDKNILSAVGNGYKVILVTGTNGKTTTTSMIYNILKSSGKDVITNSTGANMLTGIVSCFVNNFSFKDKGKEKFAVIEVDEANVKYITKYIKPEIITITNLFRDQLDRYGEVYTTLEKILEGVKLTPNTKLILNGDESLLGDLNVKNDAVYYGFGCSINKNNKLDENSDAKFCKKCKAPYKYNFVIYNHLGDFYCDNCGYKRPKLKYSVDKIMELTSSHSFVSINGREVFINQPGAYNIYNALCAYSITSEIGIDKNIIEKSLKEQKSSFGRQENIKIDDKDVKIILVKNPAGYDEAINTITLSNSNSDMTFLLNDNYADGRDVSWIWDVNFEKLKVINMDKIIISGIRLYDMAIRLKVAGLDENKFILCKDYEEVLSQIKSSNNKTIYVLATYTAMISFRKFLLNKGYIKNMWQIN